MAFHLAQPFYPLRLGAQMAMLTTGGPGTGRTPAGVMPAPYTTGFFSTLQGLPYGRAKSDASPQPWNNRYAKPFLYTIGGGLQKMPTFTSVVY